MVFPKVSKFVIVGVINTLTSYFVFTVLLLIGLYYVVASVIAYSLAILISYWLNKNWTFDYKKKQKRSLFCKFVFVNLFSLGLSVTLMLFFVERVGIVPLVSQPLSICVVMLVNYASYSYLFDPK